MGQTVAFIGLGIMGGRMVKNVLKAGYAVRAQNRTAVKAEAVKSLGATVAATPREAAAGADIVVTMVADPPALAAVLEGSDGVFVGCRRGTLVVDMSTVDPGTSRAIAAKAQGLGLRYLEAPVTGGVGAAEQGTLTIMAGGSAEDFAAAKPLLESMGKKVLHVGPVGRGSALKLATKRDARVASQTLADRILSTHSLKVLTCRCAYMYSLRRLHEVDDESIRAIRPELYPAGAFPPREHRERAAQARRSGPT